MTTASFSVDDKLFYRIVSYRISVAFMFSDVIFS